MRDQHDPTGLPLLVDLAGDRYPLMPPGVCQIGRSEHNDIVLADGAASREHAIVRIDGEGACVLLDAGSRNGTLLNGRPVTQPSRLRDGDVIAIGAAELRFRDPAVARPATMPPTFAAAVPAATMFIPQQSLITVLVVDVRGFTPLSRAIGEERLSAMMGAVFREAGVLLAGAGCWAEKFIGDAIMAVWRNQHDRLLSSELVAVLDVVMALEQLFAGLQARFDLPAPLAFGGAINTGPAAIGNMGSGNSADFTALGDTVNKTFRLETASKDLGCDLVVGEATLNALFPPLPPDRLPTPAETRLKGYETPQSVRLLRFADIPGLAAQLAG